jgi:hypothetical protein
MSFLLERFCMLVPCLTAHDFHLKSGDVKIDKTQLGAIMLEVARERYPNSTTFHRRDLMNLVEAEVRERGFWTPDDDEDSGSRGHKSKGLADIDYRFSDLAHDQFVAQAKRGYWKLRS